ncbi:MAG: iron-containing alcohol dehydrogenase [Dehalococcoidales bacterium]|nr:iron-containing alcohol dehydrogenase [Dehalococcoidales bacterium]
MQQFRFFLPTKLVFGNGVFNQLGKEASKLGKKAMVVTGSASMRKTGVLDKAVKDLNANGVTTVVFDKIEPNPRVATIDAAAQIVRQEKIDLVIGIGGGSTMDGSKAITLASTGAVSVWDHYTGKAQGKDPAPAILLVPTVAATGSEANPFAVVTNWETHDKRAIGSRFMQPKVSLIDPALTLTLPAKQTAQGGVDIFCHVVEEYVTTSDPSAVTDGICETCMKVVLEYLPKALAKLDDLNARFELSWASTVACSQFRSLGGGIETGVRSLHDIEHAVSGFYDVAHGDGLSALILAWMKFTLPARKDRFAKLAKNVFGKPDAIKAMEEWLASVNMKHNLREFNVDPKKFDAMADSAYKMGYGLDKHPIKMEPKVIAQLYKDAY